MKYKHRIFSYNPHFTNITVRNARKTHFLRYRKKDENRKTNLHTSKLDRIVGLMTSRCETQTLRKWQNLS